MLLICVYQCTSMDLSDRPSSILVLFYIFWIFVITQTLLSLIYQKIGLTE